jgi:NAD(P)-dependent dehydrogenase (short-subunit alcohol dehydrogenase family)
MRLDGKVAFISGGARGMGATEAKLFASEGAAVVFGDVLEKEGQRTEAEIIDSGGKGIFIHLDVASEKSWEKAISTTIDKFGKLNILVNNAGVSGRALIEDTSVEEWNRIMDVNVKGTFLGTKAALPELKKADGASIINISSQLGIVGSDLGVSAAYQASKGAVRLLTKATALEYASEGIRCNSVHPAPVNTELTAVSRENPEVFAKTKSNIPLGRFAEPMEIAKAVLYLASDESSFMTGSELVVDGGWTAR